VAAGALGGIGAAATIWPFIDALNPSADVLALSTVELDLSPIDPGQRVTVMWGGRPVFVDHRAQAQIDRARADDKADLRDPEPDAKRVQRAEWLVLIGICTHLGCVPLGQRLGDPHGDFGGWFCPCHGSHYDTSGRVRRGPAPKNLAVPPYRFISDAAIKIG
jgi:ubiquinol-cytochrome c reductase iron-sulfur subunit